MKCKYCGKRINKSDEICPECGTLISSSNQESPDGMGKCLKKFNCNDNLPIFVFCMLLGIAVLVLIAREYSVSHTIDPKDILGVVSGLVLIPMMSWFSFVTLKTSLCVCENGIYGVIPQKGSNLPRFFKLRYSEIKTVSTDVIRTGKGGSSSIIMILTKDGKEYRIGCLNKKNFKTFSDMLHYRLNKENPTEDVTE